MVINAVGDFTLDHSRLIIDPANPSFLSGDPIEGIVDTKVEHDRNPDIASMSVYVLDLASTSANPPVSVATWPLAPATATTSFTIPTLPAGQTSNAYYLVVDAFGADNALLSRRIRVITVEAPALVGVDIGDPTPTPAPTPAPNQGVVTTLAGSAGLHAGTDGTGSAARFYNPRGVAVDATGTIYVADSTNNTIRKVTPAGVVTTLAGTTGIAGSTDATGSAARFNDPEGIAVDASGNVYVSDSSNHTIRKVTPAGVVSTLAGTAGISGSSDGTGASASFYIPEGVAVDASGSVYVAEVNKVVRKITPAGVVTTLAGAPGIAGTSDGTGGAARFGILYGVAVDSIGNLMVADWGNHTIRKITQAGVVSTLAGAAGTSGSADGTGSGARFYNPEGVTVDAIGDVYVADWGNHTIRKITPAGVVTTLAGGAGISGSSDGTGAAARFSHPFGVAIDASGSLYVGDVNNQTIRKVQ